MTGTENGSVEKASENIASLLGTESSAAPGAAKSAYKKERDDASRLRLRRAASALLVLALIGGIIYCDVYQLFPHISGWAQAIVIGVFEAVAVAVAADPVGVAAPSRIFGTLLARLVAPKER